MAKDSVWTVKVLMPGKKRWQFLGLGHATNLRIHAQQFQSEDIAVSTAQTVELENPGIRARAEVLFAEGKRN